VGLVGLAVTVKVCGVVPIEGVTVSHDCDGNSATDVLPPVAETVMLCETAEPLASAEKVKDDELTDIVWAPAAPAVSNMREIKGKFNVFKENLHSLDIWGAERASRNEGTWYATAHLSTKIMNHMDYMSRPCIDYRFISPDLCSLLTQPCILLPRSACNRIKAACLYVLHHTFRHTLNSVTGRERLAHLRR